MSCLEVLQDTCDTTLVTGVHFDGQQLNVTYDSRVDWQRIRVLMAPLPRVLGRIGAGDALRGAIFARFVRSVGRQFDVCISGYNFADFGRPAVHFVADFSWDDEMRLAFDPTSPGLRGFMQRQTMARAAYLAATRAVSGANEKPRLRAADVVIANSHWSADLLARRAGIASRVIYPPVSVFVSDVPISRSNDFVILGRIAPDKRIEEAIEIVARVRALGHNCRLHIIGPLDESPYCRLVRRVATTHDGWVRLHGGLYGEQKCQELARHAFGIHMRPREPFGIAVVEMLKMGLVPFVPSGSGPAEIVGDSRLTFHDADEAVAAVDRLLCDCEQLTAIRHSLADRAELFSKQAFRAEVGQILETILSEKANPAAV